MAKNVDIKISFDGSDAIRGSQKLEQSFAGVNQEAEKTQDTLERSANVQAKNSKKVLDANKKQIKSINTLQTELKEFIKLRNEATDPKKVKEFNKEIENTNKEISKLSKEGGSKGFGSNIKSFFTSIPAIATAAVAAIGVAVVKVFNIQKEIQKQQSIAKNLFGSDADFRAITGNARKVAAVYDKEVNEVLKSANVLTKQFGIDQQEAFDLISEGINKGADLNEDFLDQINEYSTQFRTAGLEADEAIAIITQSVNEGVFSDKGADSIKEATIRLREFTPATRDAIKAVGLDANKIQKDLASGAKTYFEVIQEVVGATKQFGQGSKEAGQVLADVFGGAGEDAGDFIFKLDEITTNLSDVEDNTGGIEKAQNKLSGAWSDFVTSVFEGDSVISDVFTTIINGIADTIEYITDGLDDLEGRTRKLQKELEKSQGEVFSSLTDNFTNAAKLTNEELEKQIENINNLPKIETPFGDINALKKDADVLEGILDSRRRGLSNEEILLGSLSKVRTKATKVAIQGEQLVNDLLIKNGTENARLDEQGIQNLEKVAKARAFAQGAEEKITNTLIKLDKTRLATLEQSNDANVRNLATQELARRKEIELAEAAKLTAKNAEANAKKAAANRAKQEDSLQKEITKLVEEGEKSRRDIALENLTGEERILKELEFASDEIDILEENLKKKNNLYARDEKTRIENEKKINLAIATLNKELLEETERQVTEAREKELEAEIKAKQKEFGIKKSLIASELDLLNELISVNEEATEEGAKEEIFLLQQKKKLLDDELNQKIALLRLDQQKVNITDAERELIENQIELLQLKGQTQQGNIDKAIVQLEVGANQLQGFDSFLGDIFGLEDQAKIDDIKAGFSQLTSELIGIYTTSIDNQLDQNQRVIDSYDTSIDELSNKLDQEIELAKIGEANNVTLIKNQIEEEEKLRDEALAKQEALQQKRAQVEKAQQIGSLITASANIFQALSGAGPIGVILAVATIGAMFAAFAQAQSQASQASTQFEEGGIISVNGKDTKVVKGNRHSNGGEQLLNHAEVEDGELLAVLNRGATTKNKEKFSTFVSQLNAGRNFDDLMTTKATVNLDKPNELLSSSNSFTNNVDFSKTNNKLDMIYQVLKGKGDVQETSTHFIYKNGSTHRKVKK